MHSTVAMNVCVHETYQQKNTHKNNLSPRKKNKQKKTQLTKDNHQKHND